MMRHWREREFERHLSPATVRYGLGVLGVLRHASAALSRSRRRSRRALLALAGRRKGRFRWLPFAGGWTRIAISRRRRARRSRRSGRTTAGGSQ